MIKHLDGFVIMLKVEHGYTRVGFDADSPEFVKGPFTLVVYELKDDLHRLRLSTVVGNMELSYTVHSYNSLGFAERRLLLAREILEYSEDFMEVDDNAR